MAHPASETALGPMTIIAVEQYEPEAQRLVQDELAYHFLPRGVQRIVRLARWRPLRNLLFAFSEKTAYGIWGSTLCRKRCIDDTIRASLGAIDALVNLGAGFDTRAYRLPGLSTIPVFEVDSPENIAAKEAKLRRLYGGLPAAVRLVPIDFERQDLAVALSSQGYRTDRTSFFIWEAVTQYLSEAAVRKTFAFLAQATPGSRLVFTYVRKDFIDGINLYGAAPIYQRFRVKQPLWQFGMDPDRVAAFLSEYGWRETEQLGSAEWSARYIQPCGRMLPVSELERIVACVKR
ncbi:MAG TPA: SAM-dependent methyltransferase [Roseiflexaceae bacterium]|nr:SAM-dependent methyltransferase [Roseiflexaceae bacterium]